MSEVRRNEVQTTTENGTINYAADVISVIAGIAAAEIKGNAAMSGGGLSDILGKKNLNKGVKVTIADNTVAIDLSVQVNYGYKIHEVCQEVQNNVHKAIENMTGLTASEINVNVVSILFDKEPAPEIPEET